MLAAEENELSIAERVLEKLAHAHVEVTEDTNAIDVKDVKEAADAYWNGFKKQHGIKGDETIEYLLSFLLTAAPEPWHSSNDLQAYVSHLKGRDVPMSSVSPTLSNMKSKGVIVRDGLKVALGARVPEFGKRPELSLTS